MPELSSIEIEREVAVSVVAIMNAVLKYAQPHHLDDPVSTAWRFVACAEFMGFTPRELATGHGPEAVGAILDTIAKPDWLVASTDDPVWARIASAIVSNLETVKFPPQP